MDPGTIAALELMRVRERESKQQACISTDRYAELRAIAKERTLPAEEWSAVGMFVVVTILAGWVYGLYWMSSSNRRYR